MSLTCELLGCTLEQGIRQGFQMSLIVKEESIANPGHKPGFLPNFLNDMGVKVVISGGMGGGAIEIFNEKEIEVITGAAGDAKEAVMAYTQGNLKSNGVVCNKHEHRDECGEHHHHHHGEH